jgi:hypothetical protein
VQSKKDSEQEEKMKKQIAIIGLLAMALAAQSTSAKTLEEVLKEKGVITEEDYREVTKSQTAPMENTPATPANNGGYTLKMKGITVNLGGFIEAAGIYRSRNLNSDMSSKFQSLPFGNSIGYYQDETRFSARQSRLSLLATGDASPTTHLAGYYEMDFLGSANSANSNESNSYNPRIRHLYTTIDWDRLGLHLLAGQTWSLTTLNNKGITPRNEVTPLTIEAQYVPGFTWTRQPQFRIVKDFDKRLWLALSVENPQTTFNGTISSTATNSALQPPSTSNANGGGNLDGVRLSANDYPDFVFKVAYEPGWGHFEIYDVLRTFESTVNPNGTSKVNKSHITTTGVGAGVILPLVPNQLNLTFSCLYGEGIGRYGSAQLPDVTEDANGNLTPLRELQLLAGLTWDPVSSLTLYSYYGQEQVDNTKWLATGAGYGNGSNNSGAWTFGIPTTGTANANVKRVSQVTVGGWWKFYQGTFGKMQAGLQYSHTEDQLFVATVGGAPATGDHMVFSSLRYYWQ